MQIQQILEIALQRGASDIILTGGHPPSIKLNGDVEVLSEFEIMSKEYSQKLAHGMMNESQKAEFEANQEVDFSLELKGLSRFRVNAFIQNGGHGVVLRPIKGQIPEFESLLLPPVLKKLILKRHGLILITGSVGSGKTTTMASLLNEVNRTMKRHIITVEDPIEFLYKNELSIIEQREVWEHTHSFDNGLKYALRQASDVIMIGEMRDLETFRLALRAAETWNLVFATLHTSWASRAVARIIDMFPWDEKDIIRQQLSESLIWVVWQQLLKNASGTGRVLASEVLINNTSIGNMIRKDQTHQIPNAIETGKEFGMQSMKTSLEQLHDQKHINDEVYKAQLAQLDRYF